MDIDRAKEKVAKLMALAQNAGATEGEAENAMRQADALMRKFGFEEGDLKEGKPRAGFDWATEFAPYGIARQPAKTLPGWYGMLAVGVANFTDTIVRQHDHREKGRGVGYYGDRSDVLFATWLITYLRDTVWRVVAKQKDLSRLEREDFRKAMVGRLNFRMKQLRSEREEAFKQGTGTALVVVNTKISERDAEFGAPQYKRTSVVVRSQEAAHRGRGEADKVGFNKVIGGEERKRVAA